MIRSKPLRPGEYLAVIDALTLLVDKGFPLEYSSNPIDMSITIRGSKEGREDRTEALIIGRLRAENEQLKRELAEAKELSLF